MTTRSKTTQAVSDAQKSAAGADTGLGQRYQYADDASRVSDFDKDIGADERVESSGASIHDAYAFQGIRSAAMSSTSDVAEVNMRLRQAEQLFHAGQLHQSKMNSLEVAEREQRIKFAEGNHSAQMLSIMGFTADTVQEAFANRVADKVCVAMK